MLLAKTMIIKTKITDEGSEQSISTTKISLMALNF